MNVYDQVWDQFIWNKGWKQIKSQDYDQVWNNFENQIRNQVWVLVWQQLYEDLKS